MINLILSGGSGTRLWPLSRMSFPKQFLKLFGNRSLFQLTLERNKGLSEKQLIISNANYYFLLQTQAKELNLDKDITFLLEPIGRNTAPAIALACMLLDPDEVVLATPSDHMIEKEEEYKEAVLRAIQLAKDGYLVTFGIVPSYPETGYGYIQAKGEDVISFREKPDLETAKKYLEHNALRKADDYFYYWNSGIFCFKAGVYLEELEKYEQEIYKACLNAYKNLVKEGDKVVRIRYEDMIKIPEKSIDYAVMEKSNRIKMVQGNFLWSDLGSFEALYNALPKDCLENVTSGKVINIESKGNLIIANSRVVSTVNVEDLIVIDTSDALLIAQKGSGQKVKEIIEKLKSVDNRLLHYHKEVYKPWGSYEVLFSDESLTIRRIVIKPGEKLSLRVKENLNYGRHWIVVEGIANIRIGNSAHKVERNGHVCIHKEGVYEVENRGTLDLIMIEVIMGKSSAAQDMEDEF